MCIHTNIHNIKVYNFTSILSLLFVVTQLTIFTEQMISNVPNKASRVVHFSQEVHKAALSSVIVHQKLCSLFALCECHVPLIYRHIRDPMDNSTKCSCLEGKSGLSFHPALQTYSNAHSQNNKLFNYILSAYDKAMDAFCVV